MKRKVENVFPTTLAQSEMLEGNEVLLCLPYAPKYPVKWRDECVGRTENLKKYFNQKTEEFRPKQGRSQEGGRGNFKLVMIQSSHRFGLAASSPNLSESSLAGGL
ncbi:MAG: hypothetical protein GY696_17585 [Gammaproteobacteria bacterium]|nr:hypothetical protein [Gammaproteobacteria bacterium]